MSITITIDHNREYCKEHNLGTKSHDECMCVGDLPNPVCSFCGGTGMLTTIVRPFEMNMNDKNFCMLFNQLEIDATPMGQISPHKLLNHYRKIQSFCAIFPGLEDMCNEAMKRGEMVTWS